MRALTDADLDRLDLFLCRQDDEDVMLLSELDGYLTGVLVCPDLIPPSEWMPLIWGEAGAPFADVNEANEILGLVMGLYNDILGRLMQPDSYGPLIDEDNDGTYLWEFWAQGFGKALSLRPGVWAKFQQRWEDDPAGLAFSRLAALVVTARETQANPNLHDDIYSALLHEAPAMITPCVLDLHHARIARRQLERPATKTGRNDTCPCGSGKKFKRCCLAANHH